MTGVVSALCRLAKAIGVILVVATLNFVLIRLAPGDPAMVIAGEAGAADEAFVKQLRALYALDRPLLEQLWSYLSGVLRLDLGFSYRQSTPVLTLILDRLGATLLLTGAAFMFAVGVGVPLGAYAALRQGRFADALVSTLAICFFAMPLFWLSLMAIIFFSVWLDWLPASGMETIGAGYTGLRRILDIAQHLVLPASTLGLFYVATYARLTRASVLDVKDLDFVRTARAKGVQPKLIVRRHIIRNALLPVITFAGLQAGHLVGGALLTETVFAWPGIGRLAFDALLQRDYTLLMGVFLIAATLVVIFNLLTDAAYRLIDPRVGARA